MSDTATANPTDLFGGKLPIPVAPKDLPPVLQGMAAAIAYLRVKALANKNPAADKRVLHNLQVLAGHLFVEGAVPILATGDLYVDGELYSTRAEVFVDGEVDFQFPEDFDMESSVTFSPHGHTGTPFEVAVYEDDETFIIKEADRFYRAMLPQVLVAKSAD